MHGFPVTWVDVVLSIGRRLWWVPIAVVAYLLLR